MHRPLLRYQILFILLIQSTLFAQPGSLALDMLMDTPQAKCIPAAGLATEMRIASNGGLLATVVAGISDYFSIGVSYGGENVIGTGNANLNPQPGVHVKVLLVQERTLFPSIAIGFSSQGYGGYNGSLERYTIKSRGIYAVTSKNTSFLGGLGLHAGINLSLENKDGDDNPNLFAGCHKWIRHDLVVLGEYDTAINDNSDNAIGSGKGYLNLGLRWSLFQRLFIEFAWKNVLENRSDLPGSSREVKLVYLSSLRE